MRDLKHPNILNLHKVYESETHVHLILDYIRGKNLYERLLRRQKYTEELAADFTLKLLNVLDYIHSQNVVHRDIKLTNILMVSKDSDTDFKLADFGLSCEDNGHLSLRCGSPGYFAPEILRRKEYGKKVDLFSTGIVLYNMLSGQVAFCAKGPHEMLMKNMDARIS